MAKELTAGRFEPVAGIERHDELGQLTRSVQYDGTTADRFGNESGGQRSQKGRRIWQPKRGRSRSSVNCIRRID